MYRGPGKTVGCRYAVRILEREAAFPITIAQAGTIVESTGTYVARHSFESEREIINTGRNALGLPIKTYHHEIRAGSEHHDECEKPDGDNELDKRIASVTIHGHEEAFAVIPPDSPIEMKRESP